MATAATPFELTCVNTIRALAADLPTKANSGHPGAPMGMAPMAHVLFGEVLRFNPRNAKWAGRDRFVLSNGHACALLYTMLHLSGAPEWTIDQLKNFRQLGSITPGHPESHFPHIEVSTGPLGQGLSNAVGLAIGEANLAATYNRDGFNLIDNYTYVFCGDGCMQEGITSEASSLAGHLALGKLIVLYDDNSITIDGATSLSFTEDVLARYASYGWHTQRVTAGDSDLAGISAAIAAAKAETGKPSLIAVKTIIGWGSKKQGTEHVHGSPLAADDLVAFKTAHGLSTTPFEYAHEVAAYYNRVEKGQALEAAWNEKFAAYAAAHPALAAELKRRLAGELPADWKASIKSFKASDAAVATRKSGSIALNAIAKALPEIIGGSADLSPSTLTLLECSHDFQKATHDGRNIRFGVREHAMVAVANGLAAYGGFIPFTATFMNFLGYCLGAVTVAALSGHQAIYVFTHDSIGLGEDGPTHQAVEKFALCRDTPNLLFIRPADANEAAGAWIAAVENKHGPTVLALSRQNVPNIEGSCAEKTQKGAYVVSTSQGADAAAAAADAPPQLILVGTGSEVELCIAAAKRDELKDTRVRVVSFPSWELFEAQSQEYKESVFPQGVPVLSVEAATTTAWLKYAHASIGMTSFGASAPAADLYKHFGITADNIVLKSKLLLHYYSTNAVPHLLRRPF